MTAAETFSKGEESARRERMAKDVLIGICMVAGEEVARLEESYRFS